MESLTQKSRKDKVSKVHLTKADRGPVVKPQSRFLFALEHGKESFKTHDNAHPRPLDETPEFCEDIATMHDIRNHTKHSFISSQKNLGHHCEECVGDWVVSLNRVRVVADHDKESDYGQS